MQANSADGDGLAMAGVRKTGVVSFLDPKESGAFTWKDLSRRAVEPTYTAMQS
jgi:hypothetical protein